MATQNSAAGFTLIELMIVVAIIGILAAIAVPSYSNFLVNAKRAKVATHFDEGIRLVKSEIGKHTAAVAANAVGPGSFFGVPAITTQAQLVAGLNTTSNAAAPDGGLAFVAGVGNANGAIGVAWNGNKTPGAAITLDRPAYGPPGDQLAATSKIIVWE